MRKLSILVIFLIILFGLIGATPYAAGYLFKQKFLEVVNAFSQNKNLKVEVIEYKEGWLSSDAKIQIEVPLKPTATMPAPDKSAALIEIIDCHITHGPIIKNPTSNQFALAMAEIESKIIFSIPGSIIDSGNTPFANLTTLVDFKNHWHNQLLQPPLSISIPELGKFSSKGSTGSIDFDFINGALSHLNIASESKGLAFIPNSTEVIQEVDIDSFSYETQSNQEIPGQWTGNSKINLPNLLIKKTDNSVIAVQDSELTHSAQSPGPNLFGFSVKVSIKNVQTANEVLPVVGPVQLSFAVNNLNSDGLMKLAGFLRTPHERPLSKEDRDTYMKLVLLTITPSTSFTENFMGTTPLGALQNDANIYFSAQSGPITPQSLVMSLNSTLNIHAAVALVDKLIAAHDATTASAAPAPAAATTPAAATMSPPSPASPSTPAATTTPATPDALATTPPPDKGPPTYRQTLDSWIQLGYVIKDGDNYVVNFKYESGSTTINGKSMGH